MTPLRAEFKRHLTLKRLSPNTHEAYIGAVNGLAVYYQKSPKLLSDEQIQDYFVYLMEERKYAWSSCNVAFCGVKLFYEELLHRDTSQVIPPRTRAKQLPRILSQDEVWRLINSCENLKHRTLLLGVYSAGLRVSEIIALQPDHIERDRMMIRVEQGKGRKDRYTVLSQLFLSELVTYWRKYRPEKYLFFGYNKAKPISRRSAQAIYDQAKVKADITRGRGIHTLRHCFASHLIEQGVSIHAIKEMMGHTALSTTAHYLHVSKDYMSTVKSPLDALNEMSQAHEIREIQ
jgi:site-specific recombinase XerD